MQWNAMGMQYNGTEWNGMERNGMEWNGMEWNGMEWNGMQLNGVEWSGMELNGVEWSGMEWNGNGKWNGMGWNVPRRVELGAAPERRAELPVRRHAALAPRVGAVVEAAAVPAARQTDPPPTHPRPETRDPKAESWRGVARSPLGERGRRRRRTSSRPGPQQVRLRSDACVMTSLQRPPSFPSSITIRGCVESELLLLYCQGLEIIVRHVRLAVRP